MPTKIPWLEDNNSAAGPAKWIPFHWDDATDWHHYGEGFRQATDLMLTQIEREQPEQRLPTTFAFCSLGFPAIFCARHYCELMLKGIIVRCRILTTGNWEDPALPHSLLSVWKTALSEFRAYRATTQAPEFASVDDAERFIEDLASIDPSSQRFRYPIDRTKTSLPQAIDLAGFRKAFQAAAIVLDGMFQDVDSWVEYKKYGP